MSSSPTQALHGQCRACLGFVSPSLCPSLACYLSQNKKNKNLVGGGWKTMSQLWDFLLLSLPQSISTLRRLAPSRSHGKWLAAPKDEQARSVSLVKSYRYFPISFSFIHRQNTITTTQAESSCKPHRFFWLRLPHVLMA